MNEKNQQLLWDLYAGIARDAKKNQRLLWKLYASIARNVIKTQDRYAGITTNEECQQLFVAHMRVLQERPKKPACIMGFICGYCIFENLLMKFIIENDVDIICLKCVYCFKIL
jgi:hypothetical protein